MTKIVIAGGSGFLGRVLSEHFINHGVKVIILTRRHQVDSRHIGYAKWDGKTLGPWVNSLNGADLLINLNGKSVDCRYTPINKQIIYDTRIDATYVLGEAMKRCSNPPTIWINAASATIYRHAEDREMDEGTGEYGTGFSEDVCKKWERTFFESEVLGVRKVALRIAITLGKHAGAVKPLTLMTRIGLGGKQGNGNQFFSWVHEEDFVRCVDWVIKNDHASGVYNVSAPNPVPNAYLMKALRTALQVPFGLPIPAWLLEVGAWMINTETELILKSRRVIPRRLTAEGFRFRYSQIERALQSLVSNRPVVDQKQTSLEN